MKNKNLLKIPLLALLFNDTSSMENDYTIAYKGLSITQHQEKKINKLGELLALEQEKNHIFSVKVQELTAEHYRLVDRINHLLSELEASNSQKEDFQKQTHELKREVESKNENIIMLEKNIKTQKELLRTSENRIEDLTRTVEVQYANKNTSLRSSQEEIKTSKENFSRELNELKELLSISENKYQDLQASSKLFERNITNKFNEVAEELYLEKEKLKVSIEEQNKLKDQLEREQKYSATLELIITNNITTYEVSSKYQINLKDNNATELMKNSRNLMETLKQCTSMLKKTL